VFADAFAETVVETETVALDVGEVMETVGALGGAPEPLAFVKPAQPLWNVAKLKTKRNSRMTPPAFRSEFPRETLIMIPSILSSRMDLTLRGSCTVPTATSLEAPCKLRNWP
jgi:hypothetical protein